VRSTTVVSIRTRKPKAALVEAPANDGAAPPPEAA
jgi:hypothetical protein